MAEGIEPESLARLVQEDVVVRAARGDYQLTDLQVEAAHNFAVASVLVPRGVICLVSALQFHALTLQLPLVVWMAIERTAGRPGIDYPRIRFVCLHVLALTEGAVRHRVEGVEVPIIESARTIVDCFYYRTKVGLDVATEGLREGLRHRRRKPVELWRYARKIPVRSVMRPYSEAMCRMLDEPHNNWGHGTGAIARGRTLGVGDGPFKNHGICGASA